jgi:peptidyl-prolyl cis-trans isomerase C
VNFKKQFGEDMKAATIAAVVLSGFLAGCGAPQDANVTESEKAKFEAFLTFKRIPLDDKVRYERLQEEFQKKGQLAAAMVKTEKLNGALINAEVEEFRKQLVVSRYFESYLKGAVTDQGIQNFYSQNSAKYKTTKAHVGHILFRVTPDMGEIERQALLTTAHAAYSRISSGEEFSEVAKAVSEDKVSALKGGDLGWVNQDAVAPEFSQKAFSMKKDEISEPFLSACGFHILKILDEPQEITKPLESVKGDIRYQLRSEAKQAEIKRLLGLTESTK